MDSEDLNPRMRCRESRCTLYVLYGVLKPHNAQEEEGLFSLIE